LYIIDLGPLLRDSFRAFRVGAVVHLFKHCYCRTYRLATIHSIIDGQTDRQTDNSIMPIADH